MSHLYRDTVDEKERKEKRLNCDWYEKRLLEEAETNMRFLDHEQIPFVWINLV